MKDQEMYCGFSKEKQAEYQAYLKNKLGADHPSFAECDNRVKQWTKADWESSAKEWSGILKELATLMEKKHYGVGSKEVQAVIYKHHAWLKKYWTPTKETYVGLGQTYMEFEWKKAFEPYDSNHPQLAKFLSEGMKVFAERELS
jgi:hypothetical protein